MKKLLLLTFFAISTMACKENGKETKNQKRVEITFNDLNLIKSKPKTEIEKYLQKNDFAFFNNQPKSDQWKSNENEEIVQFNGEGVLVFMTYNLETYNKLVNDLKKSTYKYSGKNMKNNLEVESYINDKETIFLSTMNDPNNGRKIFSLTFI